MYRKAIRHTVVASICFAVDYTLFNLLFWLTTYLFLSQSVGVFLSVIIGYYGHTYYTYKLNKFSKKNLGIYFAQAGLMLCLSYLVLYVLIDSLGVYYPIAKFIQMLICFPINFLVGNFYSFKVTR